MHRPQNPDTMLNPTDSIINSNYVLICRLVDFAILGMISGIVMDLFPFAIDTNSNV